MSELKTVDNNYFSFSFSFSFLFYFILFWELRVRVSVMSHCHKSVTNHMSYWKNNIIQHI